MKSICFIIMILCCLSVTDVNAQVPDENLELSVEVRCIDSEYLMIPQLRILAKDKVIQLYKVLHYDNEANSVADCRFYLQKRYHRSYLNLYVSHFSNLLPGEDDFKFRDFKMGDSLNDSVNLKTFCPLDIGEYRIAIEMDYYESGEKHTVYSNYTPFQVKFRPKHSVFDQGKKGS